MNYEDILRSVGEVFSVDVRAWDGREFSDVKRLEITLKNENEPPQFKEELYTLDAEEGGVSDFSYLCNSVCSTLAVPENSILPIG